MADIGIVGEEIVAQGAEVTRGESDVSALRILVNAIDRVDHGLRPRHDRDAAADGG